jgi:hypothetical protein
MARNMIYRPRQNSLTRSEAAIPRQPPKEAAEAAWLLDQPRKECAGFIAMNNAIMTPRAKPTIVPAATPRQSTFCSPFVNSHLQRLLLLYYYPTANDHRP